jgi:hypothetical protein
LTLILILRLLLGAALIAGAMYELHRKSLPPDLARGFLLLGAVWLIMAVGDFVPEERRFAVLLLAITGGAAALFFLTRAFIAGRRRMSGPRS